jgi:predicted metalloprotease with PDZ domain
VAQVQTDVWRISPTTGTAVVTYTLFGDRVDGTYAAIDETHAHLNAPATFLWAPSLVDRPVRVRLVQPAGMTWQAATQLFPTDDALVYTAPNLQYLMDSPIEFSRHTTGEFTVDPVAAEPAASIRVAMHHLGTESEVAAFTRDVERIVREQRAIFGELPAFDTGTYTFIVDVLPWAVGDGMEHRNSTVCTASGTLSSVRDGLLGTAAHEFFHAWNVERIRPASLEPFDFTQANMSGELWFAEGFTSYYGDLTMRRAALADDDWILGSFTSFVNAALLSPGARLRSAVDMSRLAPFVDAATSIDRTNWENTYVSYYAHGASLALGLDLMLRERSGNAISLDDYMRAVWREYGRVAAPVPAGVAKPYTMDDLRRVLGDVSGDQAFAAQFFSDHVEGVAPIPFGALLEQAGFVVRSTGTAWVGRVALDTRAVVINNIVSTAPVHAAGLNRDDQVVSLGGQAVASQADWEAVVRRARVGDTIELVFRSRGQERRMPLTVAPDPRLIIVPIERAGGSLTNAQRTFRSSWFESKSRR